MLAVLFIPETKVVIALKLLDAPWSQLEQELFGLGLAFVDLELEALLNAQRNGGELLPVITYPYALYDPDTGDVVGQSRLADDPPF